MFNVFKKIKVNLLSENIIWCDVSNLSEFIMIESKVSFDTPFEIKELFSNNKSKLICWRNLKELYFCFSKNDKSILFKDNEVKECLLEVMGPARGLGGIDFTINLNHGEKYIIYNEDKYNHSIYRYFLEIKKCLEKIINKKIVVNELGCDC